MDRALFWKSTAERAVKTTAQVLVTFLGADLVDAFAVDWQRAAGVAAGAAVVSVLTSLASSTIGQPDSPSLVADETH